MRSKSLHFNTIYSRSLFFNLMLVICATLVPFTVFTNYFLSRYDQQINQYNAQMVRETQNYIDDTVIGPIIDMPNTYFSELDSNQELTYPYSHDISGDSVMIQEISTRLKNISAAYEFLDGINLYYTKSHIMFGVSGIGFVQDESFPKTIQGHEPIAQALLNADKPSGWLAAVTLLGRSEPSPAVFIRKLPYSVTNDSQAVLAVALNQDFFYRFIEKLHIDRNETLLILSPDGRIVLSTDRSQNGTALKDEGLIRKITGVASGMCSGRVFGSQSVVSYSKSKYNDWRYVSVVSTGNYYQKSAQIRLVLLLLLLLLLPLNLLLSAFSTRTAHRPLSQVLSLIRGSVGAAAGERDEYNLLENTFRGLNEKVLELSGTLEENKPLIRQNALLKLLQGGTDADGKAMRELGDIHFEGQKMACVILRLFCADGMELKDRLMIAFSLIPLLESLPGMDCKPVLDGQNRLTAIVNFAADADFDGLLARVSAAVGSALRIPYTLCAGGVGDFGYEKIHLSYTQAAETYAYAFVRCDRRILRYEPGRCRAGDSIQPKTVGRMGENLKAGEREAVYEGIDSVLSEIRRENYSIDCVRNTLMDMVTVVRMALIDLGFDEAGLFGGDIRAAFERQDSIDRFESWFKGICARVVEHADARRGAAGKEMEMKIGQYIAGHIYQDISLESAAAALYLSPGYLSKVFKNAFGMNFTDYVGKRKMEEAAKLLRQHDRTVKEIANSLGYSSVPYFIRIFKEKYGYTPKMYQKWQTDQEDCHV